MKLSDWMSSAQFNVLSRCKKGEEAAAFLEIERRLIDLINKCPVTYEQDGLGEQSIAYLHYFNEDSDYYVIEKDRSAEGDLPEQFQSQMFALKRERTNPYRYGYVDLRTLLKMGCELDFYFKPTKIIDIKKDQA